MNSWNPTQILFAVDDLSLEKTDPIHCFITRLMDMDYDVFTDEIASLVKNPSNWYAIDVIVLYICKTRTLNPKYLNHIFSKFTASQILLLTPDEKITAASLGGGLHLAEVLMKPVAFSDLHSAIQKAVNRKTVLKQIDLMTNPSSLDRSSFSAEYALTELVGESRAIQKMKEQIKEVAPTSLNVLIRGESGTGKDIVARLIHQLSDRRDHGELMKIHCPSIPENLLESELFGHEKGAFAGADRKKPGRLELANGGTVYLDGIGDIPPFLQANLVQFIEKKRVTRVGGVKTIEINTRIVSATNAPLEHMIASHGFRLDLFYRLNECCITIPPLRERIEDIPWLFAHFCRSLAAELNVSSPRISSETRKLMLQYAWPGNGKELHTVAKQFVFAGNENAIVKALRGEGTRYSAQVNACNLAEVELEKLSAAQLQSRWENRKACVLLGFGRRSKRGPVEKYQLDDTQLLSSV